MSMGKLQMTLACMHVSDNLPLPEHLSWKWTSTSFKTGFMWSRNCKAKAGVITGSEVLS